MSDLIESGSLLAMRYIVFLLVLGFATRVESRLGPVVGYADYLLWKRNNGDQNFALAGNGAAEPIGRQKRIELGHHAGFRVGAGIGLCHPGTDVMVRYLWYHLTHRDEVFAEQLWVVTGYPSVGPLTDATARARIRIRHEMAGLEFGQRLCVRVLALRLFAGVQYSWIDHKFDVDHTNETTDLTTRRNGEFFGFGPRAGLEGAYPVCGDLRAVGEFAMTILAGGERSRFSMLKGAAYDVDVRDPMKGRLVPMFEAAVGLTYDACIGCVHLTLRIGYEAMVYIGGVSRMEFLQAGSGVNTSHTTAFGLNGPFFGLLIAL